MEIVTRQFGQTHQFAKMIKRRFLILKDIRHHALLASEQDIVDVLLLLHDGAQLLVKIGSQVADFLELIKHHNHPVLFRVCFLYQGQHIFDKHHTINSWLKRYVN